MHLIKPKKQQSKKQILFLSPVQAGFPNPADGDIESMLDLNEYLIEHPAATYFVKVKGNSMQDVHIYDGDILIVDRSLEPRHDAIVVASIDGDFTVKRLYKKDGKVKLIPANKDFSDITPKEYEDFQIWGVVKHVIHSY
ncbi:translesion error-prone DNA polymerase V autoproteolytic subunit [Candidatus Dojkabacteria bacterium]|uniref:Translesion error-prone DNA polymerase V autoproteolytic subunit n=1 Tax=Candidatus Dojkabacteria bacterium TaxID=2099670 RepID=A0A955L8C0_9BACT|nr:translesion error-prone DNA polymerase V autoproteolytic subunit [Candidatus Dojkabacteria bacterium]